MKLDNGLAQLTNGYSLCHQPGFNFETRNFINLLVLALPTK